LEAEKREPSLIGAAHSALGFAATIDIAEFAAKHFEKFSKFPQNEK
jgi:hypothetical protein